MQKKAQQSICPPNTLSDHLGSASSLRTIKVFTQGISVFPLNKFKLSDSNSTRKG